MKKKRPAAPGTNVVHPNVSRVDYPGIHGYTVRIRRNGKAINKFFCDFGNKSEALAAAIAWREETVERLDSDVQRPQRAGLKPPGYSYIKRGLGFDYVGDFRYEYAAWVAFLRIENRKHLVTKWSIDKWGDEEAKRRCEAWLFKKKAELSFRLARARSTPRRVRSSREVRA